MGLSLAEIPTSQREIQRLKWLPPCGQVGLPVEGWVHKPTHKTFSSKFVLSTGRTKIKMEQRLRKWSTNDWPNMRSIPS